MSIGLLSPHIEATASLQSAQQAATLLKPLLLQARHLANNIISGWHGRRCQGSGENFWQFRPYQSGESVARIDWRRSARGHTLYTREREREAAQTIFLCPDLRPSMHYQSRFALHSKQERAILLCLVLAELLSQVGERIGMAHVLVPTHGRHTAERLALALQTSSNKEASFDLTRIPPHARAIIISDFLENHAEIWGKFSTLARHNIKAHMIEIADPAEIRFPYRGDVEFHAPGMVETIRLKRADHAAPDYKKLYLARRSALEAAVHRHGWSFYTSATDKPLAPTLYHLYLNLGAVEAGHR